jgi:signal transduction histidine kinase
MARFLTRLLWALLLGTAISVFFASQLHFAGRVAWPAALDWSFARAISWGIAAPGIFWMDRRIGRGRSVVARVALHVPLAVVWTFATITLRLVTRPLRFSVWPDALWPYYIDRMYSDIGIYVVLVAVSITGDYSRQIRERERREQELAVRAADLERHLAEARLQSLRAQLQPHFLFNALNTISAFTATDPEMARRLMGQLGDLLRASLTHAARPLITLAEELTFLDDYLAIESARFDGRITVHVDADDDVLDALVPGILLQPIVENAIRHGVAPRRSGGRIEVTAARAGSFVQLRVRDDGQGLPEGWTFEQRAGVGLRNVALRLENLYGRKDLLRVTRRTTGGVEVEIDVPWQQAPASAGGKSA